jgi:hypothetical protein
MATFSGQIGSPRAESLPPRVTRIRRERRHRDAELIETEIAGQEVIREKVPDLEPRNRWPNRGPVQWKDDGDHL